jgi:hypothetical protein
MKKKKERRGDTVNEEKKERLQIIMIEAKAKWQMAKETGKA